MFDLEHGIALHAMHGNQVSSHGNREVSWVFSSCGGNLRYILELWRGKPLETFVCLAMSGLLYSYDGHLRNLNYALQDNTDASGGEERDRVHFLVGTVILGFLSVLRKSQASSPF